MPGYGVEGPEEGSGLLPWSWAEAQLTTSRNFWLATRWPDGRPHAMPVWAVWHARALWFSSSRGSRKARNLAADPRCVLTTEDLVASEDCFFAATGVTDGDLVRGVRFDATGATTHSLVMRSKSGTIRTVDATHKWQKLMRYSALKFD